MRSDVPLGTEIAWLAVLIDLLGTSMDVALYDGLPAVGPVAQGGTYLGFLTVGLLFLAAEVLLFGSWIDYLN